MLVETEAEFARGYMNGHAQYGSPRNHWGGPKGREKPNPAYEAGFNLGFCDCRDGIDRTEGVTTAVNERHRRLAAPAA